MSATHAMPKIISFPKQRAPKSRKKRRFPVALCCLGLFVAYFTFSFISQEFELRSVRRQVAELRQAHTELLVKQAGLQAEVELLQTDEYIERLARDRLGLIKPQDNIFQPVYIGPKP